MRNTSFFPTFGGMLLPFPVFLRHFLPFYVWDYPSLAPDNTSLSPVSLNIVNIL